MTPLNVVTLLPYAIKLNKIVLLREFLKHNKMSRLEHAKS